MFRPRIRTWRADGPFAGTLFMMALLALAFVAGCDQPQAPPTGPVPGDATFRGAYDPGTGVLEFRLGTVNGVGSPLRLLASDLQFDAETQELHAKVAIHNSGNETIRGPQGILIGGFVPATVVPTNAEPLPCPLCVTCPCPFPFMFVHANTYGEDGMLSAGEASAPVEWIFQDPGGESFSFQAMPQGETAPPPGTISGSVFADANADGHRQEFEPGIPGVLVTLLHGDAKQEATTDDNGRFEFQVSEAGLYEVVRAEAGECKPTTPLRLQVFIVRRADGTLSGFAGADFGCRAAEPGAVMVAGIVYEDLNRDGHHQEGEPGLSDVLIDGATPNCPTFAPIQVRTDENGAYRLQLPLCTPYVIAREPLPGFSDTSPNPVVFGWPMPDSTGGPTSPPGPMPPRLPPTLIANFGVARTDSLQESSVEGVVFEDTNHNGRRDDDERGLPGVEVSASGLYCMLPVVGLTRTDAMGRYVLRQSDVHCPLPWSVGHEPLQGLCDTSANPVVVGDDERPDPRHYRMDFGVAPCDSLPPAGVGIGGTVFVDLNRDGRRDPGEPGVPGAEVQLLSMCTVLRATRTDAGGVYRFPPDVVSVCPVESVWLSAPMFPASTTPNPAPFPRVPPWQKRVNIDFGVRMMRSP